MERCRQWYRRYYPEYSGVCIAVACEDADMVPPAGWSVLDNAIAGYFASKRDPFDPDMFHMAEDEDSPEAFPMTTIMFTVAARPVRVMLTPACIWQADRALPN